MLILLSTTNPTLVLNPNPKRRRLLVQMQAQVVDANNTGRIHVGKDVQPVAEVGHASQGTILSQGAYISEIKEWDADAKPFKGSIWLTSSQNNQTVIVEEEIDENA